MEEFEEKVILRGGLFNGRVKNIYKAAGTLDLFAFGKTPNDDVLLHYIRTDKTEGAFVVFEYRA